MISDKTGARRRIALVVLGAVVASLLLWTWAAPSGPWAAAAALLPPALGEAAAVAQPDADCVSSRVAGGVPGFTVLDNVWYINGSLRLFSDDPASLPAKADLVSGYRLDVAADAGLGPSDVDAHFAGTTILLNAGAGDQTQYLWHYYHFAAESMLGGFAAAAAAPGVLDVCAGGRARRRMRIEGRAPHDAGRLPAGELPRRLVVPFVEGWRDQWGLNAAVVGALFGDDVIEPREWRERTDAGDWLFFERLVVVDRWVAHARNPSADTWNKMALPAFELDPPTGFFEPARHRLLAGLGVVGADADADAPVIVYVSRQGSSRRLNDDDHEGVLEVLEVLREEGAVVRHVQFEGMTVAEQVGAVADASVLLGIHGNGLSHEIWMPQSAALIEIFPVTSFLRDYQAVAQVLRHPYVCLRNDTVLEEAEWQTFRGETGPKQLHDGTEIRAPLLLDTIHRLLASAPAR